MSVALVPVTFRYSPAVRGPVSVVGTFNLWDPRAHPLARSAQEWHVTVFLPPGRYPYAFVVDGRRAPLAERVSPPGAPYLIVTVGTAAAPGQAPTPDA